MILILVGLFSLIFVGGFLLIFSLIGIRQQVRFDKKLKLHPLQKQTQILSYPMKV